MVSLRSVQIPDIQEILGNWRSGNGPLAAQLGEAIEDAVERGELLEGWVLPSERALAAAFGISRSTVVRCMELLTERGTVKRSQGAGTFIATPPGSPISAPVPKSLWARHQLGADTSPGIVAAVFPSAADLPQEALQLRAEDFAESSSSFHGDGSGYHIAGLTSTREAVAGLLTSNGLPSTPDSVIVTTGATQALSIIFELLLRPRDVVVVESPGYPTTLRLLSRIGVQILSVKSGATGTDAVALARLAVNARAKMVVLMSTCNAATGTSIADSARPILTDLATRGIVIVDDLALADYHPGPAVRSLALINDHRNIVTVGSFNKIYWGGLRVGWLRVHQSLVESAARTKAKSDSGCSIPSQVLVMKLIEHHNTIVGKRRDQVERQALIVSRFIAEHLPEWQIESIPHGPAVWIRLPLRDTADFVAQSSRNFVPIGYGGIYRSDGRASPHIRLTLTSPEAVLAKGLDDLAQSWSAYDRWRGR